MILEQLNECDIILQHRTKYQDVLITEIDGLRSLYLDGDLQFDDDNESYYHTQMIKNLNEYIGGIKNSNVCVIGGGDGGGGGGGGANKGIELNHPKDFCTEVRGKTKKTCPPKKTSRQ